MQSGNRFLGDLAKIASGALSVAAGARQEIRQIAQQRFERFANDRGWVTREEFEAARDMAVKARAVQDDMAVRLAALEEERAGRDKARRRTPAKRRPRSGETGEAG